MHQMLWAGLSHTQVERRARSGRLHRLYRGVYAVGHTNLSQQGRWMAAVLALGDRAVLSHDSAACLWQLTTTDSAIVHITIPASGSRSKRPGIRTHHSTTLTPDETSLRLGIPVTTPDRTRRDMGWDQEPTRSVLERRFLTVVTQAGHPAPEVNRRIGPYRVDFVWPGERLVVETDSWSYHSDRSAFESDRRRDRELRRRGYVVLRFTYREVTEEPDAVAAALRDHLRGTGSDAEYQRRRPRPT